MCSWMSTRQRLWWCILCLSNCSSLPLFPLSLSLSFSLPPSPFLLPTAISMFASTASVFLLYAAQTEVFVVVVLCLFTALSTPAWNDSGLLNSDLYPTHLRYQSLGESPPIKSSSSRCSCCHTVYIIGQGLYRLLCSVSTDRVYLYSCEWNVSEKIRVSCTKSINSTFCALPQVLLTRDASVICPHRCHSGYKHLWSLHPRQPSSPHPPDCLHAHSRLCRCPPSTQDH